MLFLKPWKQNSKLKLHSHTIDGSMCSLRRLFPQKQLWCHSLHIYRHYKSLPLVICLLFQVRYIFIVQVFVFSSSFFIAQHHEHDLWYTLCNFKYAIIATVISIFLLSQGSGRTAKKNYQKICMCTLVIILHHPPANFCNLSHSRSKKKAILMI